MENRDVGKESPSVDNNLKSFSEKRNSRKKVAKIASVIGVFAVLIIVLLVRPAGLLGKYVPEKV